MLELGYKPSIELAPPIEKRYVETGYEYSFNAAHAPNLLELQWRILPHFYSIDFDVAAFIHRADKISLGTQEMMEDGRPRPSLCITSPMRGIADCIATQRPLKNGNELQWNGREAAPEPGPQRKPWVENSREAAAEYSPRHKPWVQSETPPSPSGAKDQRPQGLGRTVRTLRREDLLLVLCVHAAKHVWVQLSWLCDIAQLTKSQQLDWNAIQDEATRLGIERILSLNLLLAHKLLDAPLPPQIQKRLRDDPLTTVLAHEILRIIERSAHYNTESISYFRLMMRIRERWQDQARFLWRLVFTPSVSEWKAVRLPKCLHPLYRLVRLSRLSKRLGSTG